MLENIGKPFALPVAIKAVHVSECEMPMCSCTNVSASVYVIKHFLAADMRQDVQEIFKATPHDKQVMMFSATLSTQMRPVCKRFMDNVSSSGGAPAA